MKTLTMKATLIEVGGDDPHERIVWKCPGCRSMHGVPIPPHPKAWSWNSSLNEPTLSPSVVVSYQDIGGGLPKDRPALCHCFIRDGKIQFLDDCTHDHAGKTVEMESVE